jgi:hypothetical protein
VNKGYSKPARSTLTAESSIDRDCCVDEALDNSGSFQQPSSVESPDHVDYGDIEAMTRRTKIFAILVQVPLSFILG